MVAPLVDSADSPLCLGRQPILDREQNIVAYELLFRASSSHNGAVVVDDFAATSQVVIRAFTEFGLASVLGNCLGYLNVDEQFLSSDLVELLPRERVVLEVLETVEMTPTILTRLRELKAMGFRLALDDFTHFADQYLPALALVDIVKLDLPLLTGDELTAVVQQLRRWPLKLLAEKIDNRAQFQDCIRRGFDLFQGYFFAKPTILSSRRVDPARAGVLRLMNLTLGEVKISTLEREFKHYPNLTYKLLRLVNSVTLGAPVKIHSLKQALVVLGQRPLQRWLQLLLFTQGAEDVAGQSLSTLAAVRGKSMELMANYLTPHHREQADQAFMVGVLSLLDALFGTPLPELLAELNLADSVRAALLNHQGSLGRLLNIILRSEQNQFDELTIELAELSPLSLLQFNQAQLQALGWANKLVISNER
ncbi:MAG: EAL domain-containing protein [Candidatus Contendobacter sp.]|nr:EAL domain-containing protein [Candidatus Contendobacter sp.]